MILVAGGTGLLGRRVVKLLVGRGEKVRVLTREPGRAAPLPAGIDVVVGDIRRGSLERALDGCSGVVSAVHGFAGPTHTSPAAVDRSGNRKLMAAAEGAGVARFVLVSVVGAAPDHPMSLHRMKYAAEQELTASSLAGVVIRSAPFLETWIDVIGNGIPSGRPAIVLGPGRNPINFVSADDVAAFVCLGMRLDQRIDHMISVGGPQDLGFDEIARHLLARQGRSESPKRIPLNALRLVSVLTRPFKPGVARRAAAAVVMNTTPMAFDAWPVRNQFPDIPVTSLSDLTGATIRSQGL